MKKVLCLLVLVGVVSASLSAKKRKVVTHERHAKVGHRLTKNRAGKYRILDTNSVQIDQGDRAHHKNYMKPSERHAKVGHHLVKDRAGKYRVIDVDAV